MYYLKQFKKPLNIFLIIFFTITLSVYAADTEVHNMTALGSANAGDDDCIYIVDDPNGTPLDRKIGKYEFLLGFTGSANICN